MGFGKKMIAEAESLVRKNYQNIEKMAVIAGVGSRPYYAKLGYILDREYMVKSLL